MILFYGENKQMLLMQHASNIFYIYCTLYAAL